MRYFPNQNEFNKEMEKIIDILERQGFVLEADHVYAYLMQYDSAFEDVKEWLLEILRVLLRELQYMVCMTQTILHLQKCGENY